MRNGDNPIDITITSLNKMFHKAEYYDKVMTVAREYAIYLILRKLCSKDMNRIKIGEDPWQQLDEALKQIHLAQKNAIKELTALHQCILKSLGIDNEVIEKFDEQDKQETS